MVDRAALDGLLDRAGKVFSLAGELARSFQQEHKKSRPFRVVDATSWNRHAPVFKEFCDALLDLRDSMQNPSEGFAPVANELRTAAQVAKRIRSAMQTQEGQTWAGHLDFFPELNSVFAEGGQAIQAVMKAQRLDDPFAFHDEPNNQPTALAEMLRRVVRRLQATPDLLRGYQGDHPESLNVTEINAQARVLGLGPIFMVGDAPDWVSAPNVPADNPVDTERIECLIVRHPDGSEFRIRRTGGQLDDSSTLPAAETIARLEAWIERAAGSTHTNLAERLLAGPDDVELTDRELEWLEVYLKQPENRPSAADLQASARGQPMSERGKRLARLRSIRCFNADLLKRDAECDAKMASLVESLRVREPVADTGAKHRHDDSHAKPKPKRGRKKADYKTVQFEATLAADWQRRRDGGTCKADYVKERRMTVKELDALLDRVAKRNRASE
jgi:hypothetical protein